MFTLAKSERFFNIFAAKIAGTNRDIVKLLDKILGIFYGVEITINLNLPSTKDYVVVEDALRVLHFL